jgi:hypothetical protein
MIFLVCKHWRNQDDVKSFILLKKDMSNHKISADVILLVLQRITNFIFCANKAGLKARAEL